MRDISLRVSFHNAESSSYEVARDSRSDHGRLHDRRLVLRRAVYTEDDRSRRVEQAPETRGELNRRRRPEIIRRSPGLIGLGAVLQSMSKAVTYRGSCLFAESSTGGAVLAPRVSRLTCLQQYDLFSGLEAMTEFGRLPVGVATTLA